jgi:AraC family transcriptional regulator, alkane utilization regulator
MPSANAMTGSPDLLTETPEAPVLDEALRFLHISSAIFLQGDFGAPWALASPAAEEYAQLLSPGAARLILFHVILDGSCEVRMASGETVQASAGEAVVLPYADHHVMGTHGHAPVPLHTVLPQSPRTQMPLIRHGGDGARTRILCGYLNCEDLLFHPLLRALPPLIHVRPATPSAAEWLRASARYALAESRRRPAASSRLPELLLVDCLRQYFESLPSLRSGWLAAVRHPLVGRALALLHERPAQQWTVTSLARKIGVSRTVLGERFSTVLGVPPMKYLTQWRLQVAARLLRTTSETLPEIASRVGYQSEEAFSRAFKRGLGQPPGAFRLAN